MFKFVVLVNDVFNLTSLYLRTLALLFHLRSEAFGWPAALVCFYFYFNVDFALVK